MITCNNGLFHLKNENLSLLFRVTRYGLLEQLHFGLPVEDADAEALACQPGLGWGSCLLLNDADSQSCPEHIPLLWSGSGRGDFRESPLELDGKSTNFTYVNHRILEEAPAMESGLPQAHGKADVLEITMEQPGARLYLYFSLFETALTRRAVLENTGSESVCIYKLMSFAMDLPGEFEFTSFHGGWIAEMGKHTVATTRSRCVNESTTGASSNMHNPGFLLSEPGASEDSGVVYGFNLVYSGNHYASAQLSQQGLTRVMQGISPANFCWELTPGRKFETPEAVMTCSDQGFGGMSHRMHKFVQDHIVPAYWADRERIARLLPFCALLPQQSLRASSRCRRADWI